MENKMKITAKERLIFYPGFFLVYPMIHYLIQELSGQVYYETWFELLRLSLGTIIFIGILDFAYYKFWQKKKNQKTTN